MNAILKEIEVQQPLYVTRLDNGVTLLVFDGYAEGSDGNEYECVEESDSLGESKLIGWRCVEG